MLKILLIQTTYSLLLFYPGQRSVIFTLCIFVTLVTDISQLPWEYRDIEIIESSF